MNNLKLFKLISNKLIEELKEDVTIKDYNKMKVLIDENPKKFVKYYKKLTGATNWDLPDIIYSFS